MTDRIKGFYVALEHDIRVDDAEPLINAVKCMRGVLAVEVSASECGDWIAESRVRQDLGEKLWAVLYPKKDDER